MSMQLKKNLTVSLCLVPSAKTAVSAKHATSNLSKVHKTRDSFSSSYSQVVLVAYSPVISSQFTLSVHRSRKSQKSTKTPYLGGSRSFKVMTSILLNSSSSVLVMISNMSMPICSCFHARRANICKVTTV